jgi:hypothetical protein
MRTTLICRALPVIHAMAACPRGPMAARNSPTKRLVLAVTSTG